MISPTPWIAILVLVLVVACVYWMRGFIYAFAGWMQVITVDENGNPIGKGEWHRIPKPDKIESHGLNYVVKYVARMVQSPSPRCSLIIAARDGNAACLIMGDEGYLKILEHVMLGSTVRLKKGYKGPYFPPQD